jgi:EAL domain-containing protein (putative c-di-GMP-specific phosphodiesterase class I)
VHDREITLSASVGMTLGSDLAPEALLRQAHSALARAKASGGRGRVEVHDEALGEGYVDQLQLETDLRHALEAGELRLFYQPIVALSDEHLLGYEALIRWQHPTRGLLPPGAFLAAAEDNRLTSRLGAWVLHQACWDAAGWDSALRVHVNISARHLAEPGFSELVADALAESGLAPERLELEITESTALFAADATLHAVDTVTETGVTLALDDFGTGYSAITALHRLPIHTLKIDRSFVADVVAEPATAALVQGLLQLGQGMGLQVIAEGIEDGEQARWLREHGCAMAQGYAFGRPAPLPARELDDLPAPADPGDLLDPPSLPALADLVEPGAGETSGAAGDPGDLTEDEWGPEADTGPRLRSAAVPQLDSFTLPHTAVLPAQDGEAIALPDAPETGGLPAIAEDAAVSPSDFLEPADDELPDEPAAGFDPGVFRPSRAFLELRELLAANGASELSAVPEPRESSEFGDLRSLAADPSDLSGLRPWLESFQQRLGPPSTGGLPEVSDRG